MLEQLWSLRGKWTPHLVTRPTRAGPWGRWNPSLHEHGELNKGHPYGFIPVPAFWYEGSKLDFGARRKERAPGAPTVLLFHGGGYIAGTAAEHDLCSGIAKRLVAHTPIDHVLSVDYRLAPAAPWPLPLLDAISAYAYLVSQGVDERDLLVGGDSAGGHLAIALTRWLRDEGAALGLRGPRGLLAFSPWCDLGFTHMWDPAGLAHNAECDTIDDTFGLFASSLLLRALPGHVMHQSAYISPASLLIPPTATGPASFDKFPPVFITMGGAERLGLEIAELYARVRLARGEKDVDIRDELVVSEDAVHDFLIFPWFAAEAAAAYEQLDEWLRTLLSEEDSDDELDELAELVLPSPVLLPDTPPELPAVQTQPNITPLTPISPLTPGTPLSPLSFSSWLRAARRASRSPSDRFVLRSTKSPRMRPTAPDSPAQLLEDMRHEGMHLLHLDVPALDLGASVGTFVEQYQGEEEGVWHELDGEQVSEDEGEDMD
jgi:acetyl esterase/lipase